MAKPEQAPNIETKATDRSQPHEMPELLTKLWNNLDSRLAKPELPKAETKPEQTAPVLPERRVDPEQGGRRFSTPLSNGLTNLNPGERISPAAFAQEKVEAELTRLYGEISKSGRITPRDVTIGRSRADQAEKLLTTGNQKTLARELATTFLGSPDGYEIANLFHHARHGESLTEVMRERLTPQELNEVARAIYKPLWSDRLPE